MKVSNKEDWELGKSKNQDPYGAEIYRYAEAWADVMEARLEDGVTVADCAEVASHETDVSGLTGFMYGAAVSILSGCWEHGEELRRWHNLATQIGTEGEDANESGGVLNPALINIGKRDDENL